MANDIQFNAMRRAACLKARAEGATKDEAAAAGNISTSVVDEWIYLGQGHIRPSRAGRVTEKRRLAAAEFLAAWKAATVEGEKANLVRAEARRAAMQAERERQLDECEQVIITEATRGHSGRKTITTRQVKRDSGTATVVEEVTEPRPNWLAAARLLESGRPESFARGQDRLGALQAKRLDQEKRVATPEEARAELRAVLLEMTPDERRELLAEIEGGSP